MKYLVFSIGTDSVHIQILSKGHIAIIKLKATQYEI